MADKPFNLFTHNPLLVAGATAGGLAAIAYAGACYALYSYQRNLIFHPLPQILRTPADVGLPYEDVWISADSTTEKLHAWWLPNPGSGQTMLFCHGNYGNISYNLERLKFHYSLGFSILAFDYRGYGQSASSALVPTEKSVCTDAEIAWNYLVTSRKIAPESITILGHSMGGAVAIHLAAQQPDAARLIVKSSFTTMQDAVLARRIYRLFPIQQLLTEPFDSLSKVKRLQMPVLYVHGDQDLQVPTDMSQRLYEATPEPKQLWIATGADHNNISMVAGDRYKAVIQSFCNSTQRKPALVA